MLNDLFLLDVFNGYSLEEFVRLYECAFSATSLLGFVFVMGLAEPNPTPQ
jgi:hypothetical protein